MCARTYTVSVGMFYYIIKCPVHMTNLSENKSIGVLYVWPKSIKARYQGADSEINTQMYDEHLVFAAL